MIEYLNISCPNCKHVLRVRKQYVGKQVSCSRCNHGFVVEAPDESTAESKVAANAPVSHEACEKQIAQLREELEHARQESAKLAADNGEIVQQLQHASDRLLQSESRVSELERSLADHKVEANNTRKTAITLESLENLLTDSQAEVSSSKSRIEQLEQQSTELRAERDRLERDLQRISNQADEAQRQAAALQSELESLRAQSAAPSNAAPSNNDGLAATQRQIDELNDRLQIALEENNELRSVVRGLGIAMD